MRPCRFCAGVGVHFLTCKLLNLQPGWRERMSAWTEATDENEEASGFRSRPPTVITRGGSRRARS